MNDLVKPNKAQQGEVRAGPAPSELLSQSVQEVTHRKLCCHPHY
jgi:hypothetical protein